PRRRGEPGAELFRLADSVEVLDEPQPRRLSHVGRVVMRQPVRASGCPDEAREAVDDLVPGDLVAGCGPADQFVEAQSSPKLKVEHDTQAQVRAVSATLRVVP